MTTSNPTRETRTNLVILARAAIEAEYGSEEHIDAENAFFDIVNTILGDDERNELDEFTYGATGEESIHEAFRLIGNDTTAIPAAACNRCGGWTGFGGMSHHADDNVPFMKRTGCYCHRTR